MNQHMKHAMPEIAPAHRAAARRQVPVALSLASSDPATAHTLALRIRAANEDAMAEQVWETIAKLHPFHVPTQVALASIDKARGQRALAAARWALIEGLHQEAVGK